MLFIIQYRQLSAAISFPACCSDAALDVVGHARNGDTEVIADGTFEEIRLSFNHADLHKGELEV